MSFFFLLEKNKQTNDYAPGSEVSAFSVLSLRIRNHVHDGSGFLPLHKKGGMFCAFQEGWNTPMKIMTCTSTLEGLTIQI